MTAAEYKAMMAAQEAASPGGGAEPTGPIHLRGVDQARKRIVAAYKAAKSSGNASDVPAVGAILDEFDDSVRRFTRLTNAF